MLWHALVVRGAPGTRYARSGSLVIAYQDGGGGGVPVVWVPGFVSHVELHRDIPCWGGILERLERFARLITFDKRGTGLSDRSLGVGTLEDRMDDIRAVYDRAGWSGPASSPCRRADRWPRCSRPPTQSSVDHLVVYGSYTHSTTSTERRKRFRDRFEAEWGTGMVAGLLVQHCDDSARATLARFERYACTPTMVADKYDADAALDVRATLGAVSVPTLVLHNAGDPFMPVESSRALAGGIPGARFVELPGDFHASWRPDDYDQIVDQIEEFVTGTHTIAENRSDRVLQTVLFTDIVDSTRRAGEVGDRRWHEILDEHDRTVRAELTRYRGPGDQHHR